MNDLDETGDEFSYIGVEVPQNIKQLDFSSLDDLVYIPKFQPNEFYGKRTQAEMLLPS